MRRHWTFALAACLTVCGLAVLPAAARGGADVLDEQGAVVLKDADEGDIPALVRLLADKREPVRSQAREILTGFGSKAVPALLESLEDRAAFADAARALGVIRDESAIVPLSTHINDSDWPKAKAARDALVGFGDKALPRLRELLKDASYNEAATAVLEQIRSSASLELARSLLKDPDPEARGSAAHLLGAWSDTNSAGEVEGLLGDPNPYVRGKAAMAYMALAERYDRQALYRLLKDESAEARGAALEMLDRSPHPDNFGPLLDYFNAEKDPMPRSVALSALGRLDDPRVSPIMLDSLKDPDRDVVVSALYYLTEKKVPGSSPRILELFRGEKLPEDKMVLRLAIEALRLHGGPVDTGVFLGYLKKGWDREQRAAVLEFLASDGRKGDRGATAAVEEMMLWEKDAAMLEKAGRALARMK